MIDYYDPEVAPDLEAWLDLDEGERLVLVEEYHRDARIRLPKSARTMHAAIHVIVENQLAMEDQQIVRVTLKRLMNEGLSRHDAVHAIGSVVAEYIYGIAHSDPNEVASPPDPAAYHAALEVLTAEKWRYG
jgi:Domain of unknown function (DUF1841)